MKKRKSYKGRIVALYLALTLCLGLFIALTVWFFGKSYPQFESAAGEVAPIPGLKEGISPQGLCDTLDSEYGFAMSGYMADKSPSRVYLIGRKGAKYFTVSENGKQLTNHFGGVTCSEKYLWLACGKRLIAVNRLTALAAEDGACLPVEYSFDTGIQNAYCYYAGGKLYAGEFYREGNYETDESHHMTKNGETNYAFVYEFELNGSDEVTGSLPSKVLSVRGLVQGIAVYEDKIYLSASYGLADSHLYSYENVLLGEPSGTVEMGGGTVNLYRLDGEVLLKDVTAPCMSEELFVRDGQAYVLFESLCVKYKLGVRYRIDQIITISIEAL